MANPVHREKLCEGASAWNAWRAANPLVAPDLEALELSLMDRQISTVHGVPVDLGGARLRRADLGHAMLVGADLSKADLVEAHLANANLIGANLGGADLTGAILDGADLAGANMHGAIVVGARLFWATNLTQAQVDSSYGAQTTALPPHVAMPPTWLDSEARSSGGTVGDLYAILGVTARASGKDLLAAYRARAKILHPDRNPGDPDAEPRFKALSHAINILRDPALRVRYDRGELGASGRQTLLGVERSRRWLSVRAFGLYFLAPFTAFSAAAVGLLALLGSPPPSPLSGEGPAVTQSVIETGTLPTGGSGGETPVAAGWRTQSARVSQAPPVEIASFGPTEEVTAQSFIEVLAGVSSPTRTARSPRPVLIALRAEATEIDVTSSAQPESKRDDLPPVTVVTPSQPKRAAGPAKPGPVIARAEAPPVKAPRAEAGHERSDLPFVAPSCKLTPACRANLEMCSC